MSWAEAMKEIANVAARDRFAADANVLRSTPSNSWNPHEVWLTRIQQPHNHAADQFAASTESQVRRLPD